MIRTLLVALASKNIHKSLSVWCLKSFVENYGEKVDVLELNINQKFNDIFQSLIDSNADILAFSCYIWNIQLVEKLCRLIKNIYPQKIIVLGGPEITANSDYDFADHIIVGAGELAFYDLLNSYQNNIVPPKTIVATCSNFNSFPNPYTEQYFSSFASEQINEIGKRLIYFEASRGCPFSCSYCLSSTSNCVLFLDFPAVKARLELLIKNGAKCIKFVDRTFNANKSFAMQILDFVKTLDTDCVFHFEVAADLFDQNLLDSVASMPNQRVQFEIGIQSTNPQTLQTCSRKTNLELAFANIQKLQNFANCHLHLDLIVGLPFDTEVTIYNAIDDCLKLRVNTLQLGFLKMLKGTEIRNLNFGAVYADFPPYEVYKTQTLSEFEIAFFRKLEKILDRFYNSGKFASTIDLVFQQIKPSEFLRTFTKFCEHKFSQTLPMSEYYILLIDFLTGIVDCQKLAESIQSDVKNLNCPKTSRKIQHILENLSTN